MKMATSDGSDRSELRGHDVYQLISAPNVGTIFLNISSMIHILMSAYKKKKH